MNNVKQTFTITIPSKTGYMDLTEDVMECVRRSNIRNGIISISSMHTTASARELPISDREISLGLTQYIIYMDFDGEREKTVEINIIGE